MRRFAAVLMAGALVSAGATTVIAKSGHHNTHLQGRNEVPAVVTGAQGQAKFTISDDGSSISYKLIVANIEDVLQAHIHLGAAGVNGQVVVFLFGPTPPGGVDVNGELASGTFDASDLVGPLAGDPLSDLIAAIESGGAYVNVHTEANKGGEIRGQL